MPHEFKIGDIVDIKTLYPNNDPSTGGVVVEKLQHSAVRVHWFGLDGWIAVYMPKYLHLIQTNNSPDQIFQRLLLK